MRTTLTLDDDVARLIEETVHRERRTTKEVVNSALRVALSPTPPTAAQPYQAPVHQSGIRGGIDPARLNHLVDDLAEDAAVADTSR
ncbi:hypothetical protein [Nostocoides australiense]